MLSLLLLFLPNFKNINTRTRWSSRKSCGSCTVAQSNNIGDTSSKTVEQILPNLKQNECDKYRTQKKWKCFINLYTLETKHNLPTKSPFKLRLVPESSRGCFLGVLAQTRSRFPFTQTWDSKFKNVTGPFEYPGHVKRIYKDI